MRLALLLAFSATVSAQSAYVVVMDDVGRVDLEEASARGLTPVLDALAARGVTFSRAVSNAVCSPGRSSIVTGLYYAGDRGVVCNTPDGDPLPPGIATIGTEAPYEAVIFGKWHLGKDPVEPMWQLSYLTRGFSHWVAGMPANVDNCLVNGGDYDHWMRVDDAVDVISNDYQPAALDLAFKKYVASKGMAMSKSMKVGERLYYVCPQLAHGPFHVPPPELLPEGYVVLTPRRERYLAMIGALDTNIGAWLASVDYEQDLVIVIGDNGTPQRVAPDEDRAKTTTFARGVDVPLIVAGSGFQEGAIDTELRHAVDIFPTLQRFWGQDLLPVDGLPLQDGAGHEVMVVTGTTDLAAIGYGLKLRRDAGTEALYELEGDEMTDLIEDPLLANELSLLRASLDSFEMR